MVPVRIADILYWPGTQSAFLVLQEPDRKRALAIVLGVPEAMELAFQLRRIPVPRPYTSTFIHSILQAANASVEEVTISGVVTYEDEWGDFGCQAAYVARVVVTGAGEARVIDARPSDALPLAALLGLPIHVAGPVMEASHFTFPPELQQSLGVGIDHLIAIARQGNAPSDGGVDTRSAEEARDSYDQERAVTALWQHVFGHLPVNPDRRVYIRVVTTPPGPAPEHIRKAWVGLQIPLPPGERQARMLPEAGWPVGIREWLRYLLNAVLGRKARHILQYVVRTDDALAVLGLAAPEAAEWWKRHPELLGRSGFLGVPADVCELSEPRQPPPAGDRPH